MQFLQSPIWVPLSVIVPILTFFGGIYVAWKVRKRKALVCEVLSNVPLVSVRQDLLGKDAEDIEIYYHGTPVKNVQVVVVRIWNAGNVSIAESDFVKPLELRFDGQVLTAAITQATPSQLRSEALDKASLKVYEDNVTAVQLQPFMLNKGDSMTLQVILTNSSGVVVPIARILEVPEIQSIGPGVRAAKRAKLFYRLLFGFSGIVGVLSCIDLFTRPITQNIPNVLYAGVLLLFSIGGLVFTWLMPN